MKKRSLASGRCFTADGFDVGDVGVTRMSATGKVYNLKRLHDFDGTYTAVAAEGTAVAALVC